MNKIIALLMMIFLVSGCDKSNNDFSKLVDIKTVLVESTNYLAHSNSTSVELTTIIQNKKDFTVLFKDLDNCTYYLFGTYSEGIVKKDNFVKKECNESVTSEQLELVRKYKRRFYDECKIGTENERLLCMAAIHQNNNSLAFVRLDL